jgi:hypothetical protein
MKFLVTNYSCLQNPRLGLPSPDPRSLCPLSSTEFVEPPPPRTKILGTPLILMECHIFIFLKTVLVENGEWVFRLSTTSLLVVSYLVRYSDVDWCSQMRRRLMKFLKLNCVLGLYLVLLMKVSWHRKFIRSIIHSFISLYGLWCALRTTPFFLEMTLRYWVIGQEYVVLGTVDSCRWWLYMALIRSFETSGTYYPMTKHHISEDCNPQHHWSEKLQSLPTQRRYLSCSSAFLTHKACIVLKSAWWNDTSSVLPCANAVAPLVGGSGGSCNLLQEISFHIVKFS